MYVLFANALGLTMSMLLLADQIDENEKMLYSLSWFTKICILPRALRLFISDHKLCWWCLERSMAPKLYADDALHPRNQRLNSLLIFVSFVIHHELPI